MLRRLGNLIMIKYRNILKEGKVNEMVASFSELESVCAKIFGKENSAEMAKDYIGAVDRWLEGKDFQSLINLFNDPEWTTFFEYIQGHFEEDEGSQTLYRGISLQEHECDDMWQIGQEIDIMASIREAQSWTTNIHKAIEFAQKGEADIALVASAEVDTELKHHKNVLFYYDLFHNDVFNNKFYEEREVILYTEDNAVISVIEDMYVLNYDGMWQDVEKGQTLGDTMFMHRHVGPEDLARKINVYNLGRIFNIAENMYDQDDNESNGAFLQHVLSIKNILKHDKDIQIVLTFIDERIGDSEKADVVDDMLKLQKQAIVGEEILNTIFEYLVEYEDNESAMKTLVDVYGMNPEAQELDLMTHQRAEPTFSKTRDYPQHGQQDMKF